MRRILLVIVVLISAIPSYSQSGKWEIIDANYSRKIDAYNYVLDFTDISCADKNNCIAVGNFSYNFVPMIRVTTDGGKNWRFTYNGNLTNEEIKASRQPRSLLVSYPDTNLCVILLDSGYILRSIDKGNTWTKSKIDCRMYETFYYYSRFCMLDANIGGFSDGSSFYLTEDGALSWKKINYNLQDSLKPLGIDNLFFLDKDHIFLIVWKEGYARYLLKSKDRGKSWTASKPFGIDTSATYRTICFVDENTGWVAGGISSFIEKVGTVYTDLIAKTKDGGNTWTVQNDTLYKCYGLNHLYFTDSLNGFACGDINSFWRTSNGGKNWKIDTAVNSKAFYGGLTDIAVISPDLIYGVTDLFGKIYKYSTTTGIVESRENEPTVVLIKPNVLNKGEAFDIDFNLISASTVRFVLYNNLGNVADQSETYNLDGGAHTIRFRSDNINTSGMYWIRMIRNNNEESIKPVVIQ